MILYLKVEVDGRVECVSSILDIRGILILKGLLNLKALRNLKDVSSPTGDSILKGLRNLGGYCLPNAQSKPER